MHLLLLDNEHVIKVELGLFICRVDEIYGVNPRASARDRWFAALTLDNCVDERLGGNVLIIDIC